MKKVLFYSLFLLFACNNSRTESKNLEGVYTAFHQHEFGKTNDTLIVTKPNDGNNIFKIVRHSGVVRTVDGKTFPKKITVDMYIVKYDEQNKILNELRTGKIFTWNSEKQQLNLGATQFVKQ